MIRREFLSLGIGALTLACGCSTTPRRTSKSPNGCFATAVGSYFPSAQIAYRRSSGRPDFDSLLAAESNRLRNTFKVNPSFSYFEESLSLGPNALATSERLLDPSSDGTVLFGTRFINKVLRWSNGELNVAAPSDLRTVLAHEYAHIFQLKLNNVYNMPTPWRELQADFLASWHIEKHLDDKRFSVFAGQALYTLGDLDYTNPQHHGTHSQRLVMGLEGAAYATASPAASPYDAASMAAGLLRISGSRVAVQATRRWFEGVSDTLIGD